MPPRRLNLYHGSTCQASRLCHRLRVAAAPTPDDGLAVLRRHSEALGEPAALALIDSNVERLDDDADPGLRELLLNRRLIIQAFQRAGLDGAAAVMRGEVPDDDIGRASERLNCWLQ